jgi:hypothetical protein
MPVTYIAILLISLGWYAYSRFLDGKDKGLELVCHTSVTFVIYRY